MIYKAFLNRQEITGFPVKGKETSEIWGGNVLLWKKQGKNSHPFYSQYFMVNDHISNYGDHLIDEYGAMLVFNKKAEITKCGAYVEKRIGGLRPGYHRTLACRGKNITYVTYVPYLAYRGELIYDGRYVPGMATFDLSESANGVWSHEHYSLIYANLTDKNGTPLTVNSVGYDTKNARLFDDLNLMKNWLNKE